MLSSFFLRVIDKIKPFYNLISEAICSNCTDFCLQIFVYNCVFWKRKNNTHETFHILKMKAHFKEESHFGNERSF